MRPPSRPVRRSRAKTRLIAGALGLALGGLAPAAWAQKPVDFQVAHSPEGRFAFRGPDGTTFLELELSDNFVVYYNPADIPLEFVDLVVENLEQSWRFFHDAGYRHPAFADAHRVAAYIRPSFPAAREQWAAGFYRLFARGVDPYFDLRYYDLSVGNHRDFCRALVTHEFFHFIQHAYDAHFTRDSRWLWEATAAWSEDERLPGAPVVGSFLRHMPPWYLLWGMGLSLNSYNPGDANIRSMPYGSAVYFKYLSGHHPAGEATVRRIWEALGAGGAGDSLGAIQGVLGGPDPFAARFGAFATAVVLKTSAPWSLPRGGEIRSIVTPRMSTRQRYFADLEEDGRRIEPQAYTLEPFSASYFDWVAPEGTRSPSRLRVVLQRQEPAARVVANALGLTRRWQIPADVTHVEPVLFEGGRPYAQLTVDNYGFIYDATSRVLLVVANPEPEPRHIRLAAAVSEPPYLQELTATTPGGRTVYQAAWQDAGAARRLAVTTNRVEILRGQDRTNPLDLFLTFSEEMQAAVVRVAGQEVRLADSGDGRVWTGQLGATRVERTQKTLPLEVTGRSLGDLGLDGNPATPVSLEPETLRWKNQEPPGGGADAHHILQLERELDLNGRWRSGPVEVRIRHVAQSVEATTQQGRVLFRGALNGMRLNGQMRARYPAEWQQRCPGQAEGWATLQLAVSEDMNQLNGQFELMEIDERCAQVHSGWRAVTFTRVLDE